MSSHARSLRQAYDPYGFFSSAQDQALLGFNGQIRLEMTALYPLGNGYRNYSPVLRRFQSTDSWSPFGRGGLNSYVYCGCDPVNHQDPSGHMPNGQRGRQMARQGSRRRFNSIESSSSSSSSERSSRSPIRFEPNSPPASGRPVTHGDVSNRPRVESTYRRSPSPEPSGWGASGPPRGLRRSEAFGGALTNLPMEVEISRAVTNLTNNSTAEPFAGIRNLPVPQVTQTSEASTGVRTGGLNREHMEQTGSQ